jgi:hypothetical protein
MRDISKIYWFGFIFSCIVHFGLLLLCLLFSFGIVEPESLGITRYLLNYTGRLTAIVLINSVLLILYLKRRYYLEINRVFIVFLLTLIFFLDTLGNFWGWYDINGIFAILWFDDFVHFVVPILISIGLLRYLFNIKQYSKGISLILASAISFGITSLWEIYEYWSDRLFDTKMLKGGIDDTMIDLSVGLLGILVFYLVFGLLLKKRE